MNFIVNLVEKIKPNFEKGGKYEKWHSVFESFETFIYVPKTVTKTGTHIRDAIDMKRTMIFVVIALIPALLFGMWNIGDQYFMKIGESAELFDKFWFGLIETLPLIIVSYGVGLGVEFIFVYLRGHEINEGFLVSGMLIPMVMPVTVPLWMVAIATIFAVVIGKEAFGGTGMNLLNPALTARAFLFFAYPSSMSGEIWIASAPNVDTLTGATPLGDVANGIMNHVPSMADSFFGNYAGSIGETSTIAILIGAVILIWTGIGSWKIMLSGVVGAFLTAFLLHNIGSETNLLFNIPPMQHLLLGGFAFGIVFMATDPVSAAQTSKGKYIYGFLIGFFAIVIRVLNPAYPEGVMLAILLMNVFAPLIDHYVVESNISKRLKRGIKVKAIS